MTAKSFLKVGIVLLLSSPVFSQQIPFDFFFGRIVGREQVQASYSKKFNNPYAIPYLLQFSGVAGYPSIAEVTLPQFLTETRYIDGRHLDWRRPPLSGRVLLGNDLRYSVSNLVWRREGDNPDSSQYRNVRFEHSLTYLSGGTVSYRPGKSALYYLQGLSLNRGGLMINLTHDFDYNRYHEVPDAAYSFLPDQRWDEERKYENSVNFDPYYGLTDKVQIGFGLNYRYLTEWGTSNTIHHESDSLNLSHRDESRGSSEGHKDELTLSPSALLFFSPRFWSRLRSTFAFANDRSSGAGKSVEYLGDQWIGTYFGASLNTSNRVDQSYDIDLTYLTRENRIDPSHLLDNFSNYYGVQLEKGTFLFRPQLSYHVYDEERVGLAASSYAVRNKYTTSKYVGRDLTCNINAGYFPRENLKFGASFSLDTHMEGSKSNGDWRFHYQQYTYFLLVDYRSFIWEKGKREEIGWGNVSDIDYLLGPLLRQHDWCATLKITPPSSHKDWRSNNQSVFNFFKGEFNDLWYVESSLGVGAYKNTDVHIGLNWQHSGYFIAGDNMHDLSNTLLTISPEVRIQPIKFFRLSVSLTGEIARVKHSAWSDHYNTNHWQADVTADLVF